MTKTIVPRPAIEDISEGKTATIASGASLSGAIDLEYLFVTEILIPSTFDGTAITFQKSDDNSTFYDLYDEDGVEINFPASASRIINISQVTKLYGFRYLKIRAGTAASPTAQTTTDTILTVMVRSL